MGDEDRLTAELIRVREDLNAALAEEVGRRRRATVLTIIPNVAVLVIVALLLFLVSDVRAVEADSRQTVERLEDCTLPQGKCYQEFVRNGQQGIVRLMDYNACLLLVEPRQLTVADIERCKARVLQGINKP